MSHNFYSPSQQDYIHQLSIDCVIFGYLKKQLHVLIPKLNFKGDFWALPSGFIYQNEDLDAAAKRILCERTGLDDIYLSQFYVFGKAARNNLKFIDKLIELNPDKLGEKGQNTEEHAWVTRRFISVGYYALLDIEKVLVQQTELDETIGWHPISTLPQMIMDHNEMVEKALVTLRFNLNQNFIAYNLLPETFTMREIQEVYEAVYNKPFARNNFQKMILDMNVLERLEKKFTGAANKAPYLYRFASPDQQNEERSF